MNLKEARQDAANTETCKLRFNLWSTWKPKLWPTQMLEPFFNGCILMVRVIFIFKHVSENWTIFNMSFVFGTCLVTNGQLAPWTFFVSQAKFKALNTKEIQLKVDLATVKRQIICKKFLQHLSHCCDHMNLQCSYSKESILEMWKFYFSEQQTW